MSKLTQIIALCLLSMNLFIAPAFAQYGGNHFPPPNTFQRGDNQGQNTNQDPNMVFGRDGRPDEASFSGRPPEFDSQGGSPSGRQFGQLQACQARENAVKQRSSRLVILVNNMLATFDTIASRVESYYTSKLVPAGKTVSNYDSLLSDIQSKRTAVQTALVAAQNDQSSFSCSSSDPRSQVMQFNDQMRGVKQALQNYRTSIKNLIVAVHSVAEEDNTASGSAQHS